MSSDSPAANPPASLQWVPENDVDDRTDTDEHRDVDGGYDPNEFDPDHSPLGTPIGEGDGETGTYQEYQESAGTAAEAGVASGAEAGVASGAEAGDPLSLSLVQVTVRDAWLASAATLLPTFAQSMHTQRLRRGYELLCGIEPLTFRSRADTGVAAFVPRGIHGWFCPQCPSDQWSGHRRSVVGSPIKICDDCEGLLVLVGQETSAAVPPVAPVPTAAPLTFRSRADTGVGVASGADTGVASTTIGGPPCILELVAAQSCIDDNNDTQVDNDTQVYNDEVDNDTQVYNDAQVDNDTQVYNDAQVDNDDTQVDNDAGDAQVDNDAADDDLSQATQCDRCDGWARRCACPPIDQVIPAMGLPIAIVGIESDTEDEPPPSSRHGGEDKLHF